MKFLHNINNFFGKQENPLQDTTSILGKLNFTLRDTVFQHAVSLIDDETNSTYNMIIDNGINTILDALSMPLKNIEDIEGRINKRHTKLSLANTNRLKVLTSVHIHNERIGAPLNEADWLDVEIIYLKNSVYLTKKRTIT